VVSTVLVPNPLWFPAFKNKGVQLMLRMQVLWIICPPDRYSPPIPWLLPRCEESQRPAHDNAPFQALAFKVMADPYGKLTS